MRGPPSIHGCRTRGIGALALLIALGASVACGGSKKEADGPNAQSAERQSEAEYDVARDLFYKGNPRGALDHALKAAELDDENHKALYFVSTVYLSFCAGPDEFRSPDCRLGDAERFARKAMDANAEFRDARNLLGQILILQKRYREAIAVLEPLTKDPAYAAAYLAWGNLGWAQVLAGDVDGGIASLRNAVTQPRFCVGHYRLGVAYEKRGDWARAEASFTDALSVDSPECRSLQDAWEARGRVRSRLGRASEAREDFEHCKEISGETTAGKSCARAMGAAPAKGTNE